MTLSVEDILALPETQRLAEVAKLTDQLKGDTEAIARTLTKIRAPSTREVAERWAPVVKESVEGLAKSQRALRQVMVGMRAMGSMSQPDAIRWIEAAPGRGLLKVLIETATSLADLVVRLHGLETEIRSIEMLGTVRSSVLADLPSDVRAAVVADAKKARLQLEDSGG